MCHGRGIFWPLLLNTLVIFVLTWLLHRFVKRVLIGWSYGWWIVMYVQGKVRFLVDTGATVVVVIVVDFVVGGGDDSSTGTSTSTDN